MMDNLINRQTAIDAWKEDFKGFVNSLDIPRDDYKGIMEYIDELPSAEPEVRCVAEIKFSKEDLEEIFNEKIEEIKEMKSENDDFLNFLYDMINPNEMESYLAMYNSQGEAEDE